MTVSDSSGDEESLSPLLPAGRSPMTNELIKLGLMAVMGSTGQSIRKTNPCETARSPFLESILETKPFSAAAVPSLMR